MENVNKIQHTPEPWKVETRYSIGLAITDQHEETNICSTGAYHGYSHIQQANAKRIVECVNACAGIDNPHTFIKFAKQTLDSGALHNAAYAREIEQLRAERDELIELAKEALLRTAGVGTAEYDEFEDDLKKALERIAGFTLPPDPPAHIQYIGRIVRNREGVEL